jgi:hypothetical protein
MGRFVEKFFNFYDQTAAKGYVNSIAIEVSLRRPLIILSSQTQKHIIVSCFSA